jgi:thioredoxin reductase
VEVTGLNCTGSPFSLSLANGRSVKAQAIVVAAGARYRRAVGDARSGSVKRVGGAIGEGAAVVAQLHSYLAARRPEQAATPSQ